MAVLNHLFLLTVLFHVNVISRSSTSTAPNLGRPFYADYLSTKTPYRFIENTDDAEITYEGCEVKKLWAVLRHGTRTPGKETTDFIKNRLPKIRDLIVTSSKNDDSCDINSFKKWNFHAELDDQKTLTHTGEDEMINLGERFGSRFPKILPEDWYNSSYLFRYTDTERTKNSAKYFTTGLFGRRISNHVWYPEPLKRDPILRFYKLCEKWRMDVKKNPKTYKELEKFLSSEIMNQVVLNITNRLGLPEGTLDTNDVQLIYTTCCFETAWDKYKKSPWCDLLTVEEFKILEYTEDMEYFWVDGYGHELTPQIACVMLQDAFQHLKTDNDRLATFYFTHSGTILKLLSHLGLYRDSTQLSHDAYEQSKHRTWKTSKIDVFASNIAFVRFDCSDGPKILTLHQERPVKLPGCPTSEDLCPLNIIEEIYAKSLTSCDFDAMCSLDEESLYQKLANKLRSIFGL
ncbi:multiple inositol polyphosphate phosphatase 1-like [Planococcus citri]|uniref:multiple inositol polyphosphate phosphatase 1-like n=1 Tax=Planococcus citri TaxID=170843 RepID=UPI0031F80C2B